MRLDEALDIIKTYQDNQVLVTADISTPEVVECVGHNATAPAELNQVAERATGYNNSTFRQN
ncbi:hypothetical protein PGT21_002178 [Puccinia graminis f. sp. tritici]|uniref:Uncharacterized protein n=1 Tax=Puccinia graminis f. sp. tritici TaxID=56615 RepID=A0A5B0S4F9_PUCGR|nr:hypothetical protein PGT21_002178 [Puccinia graminis f. sp. tritici]KAA1132668.1 hypothetical protein PGTUg99_011276 [Puccinia graminis f. sp. tritici]